MAGIGTDCMTDVPVGAFAGAVRRNPEEGEVRLSQPRAHGSGAYGRGQVSAGIWRVSSGTSWLDSIGRIERFMHCIGSSVAIFVASTGLAAG